jgi:hypothetical protein
MKLMKIRCCLDGFDSFEVDEVDEDPLLLWWSCLKDFVTLKGFVTLKVLGCTLCAFFVHLRGFGAYSR